MIGGTIVMAQRPHRRVGRDSPNRGPQKMADVIAGLMARRGYAQIKTSGACAEAWQQAAGANLGQHSRAGNVRRGVLEVMVRNSAVLQELTFNKEQLLAHLADLLPDQKIAELRFRVGQID